MAAPGKVVHEAWSLALLHFTSQHSRSDCRTILGLPAGLLRRWRRAGARGSRSSGRADLAFPWPGLRSAASGHSSLLGLRFAFQPPAVTRAAPSCSEPGSGVPVVTWASSSRHPLGTAGATGAGPGPRCALWPLDLAPGPGTPCGLSLHLLVEGRCVAGKGRCAGLGVRALGSSPSSATGWHATWVGRFLLL